jgi:hypothetical protein
MASVTLPPGFLEGEVVVVAEPVSVGTTDVVLEVVMPDWVHPARRTNRSRATPEPFSRILAGPTNADIDARVRAP